MLISFISHMLTYEYSFVLGANFFSGDSETQRHLNIPRSHLVPAIMAIIVGQSLTGRMVLTRTLPLHGSLARARIIKSGSLRRHSAPTLQSPLLFAPSFSSCGISWPRAVQTHLRLRSQTFFCHWLVTVAVVIAPAISIEIVGDMLALVTTYYQRPFTVHLKPIAALGLMPLSDNYSAWRRAPLTRISRCARGRVHYFIFNIRIHADDGPPLDTSFSMFVHHVAGAPPFTAC